MSKHWDAVNAGIGFEVENVNPYDCESRDDASSEVDRRETAVVAALANVAAALGIPEADAVLAEATAAAAPQIELRTGTKSDGLYLAVYANDEYFGFINQEPDADGNWYSCRANVRKDKGQTFDTYDAAAAHVVDYARLHLPAAPRHQYFGQVNDADWTENESSAWVSAGMIPARSILGPAAPVKDDGRHINAVRANAPRFKAWYRCVSAKDGTATEIEVSPMPTRSVSAEVAWFRVGVKDMTVRVVRHNGRRRVMVLGTDKVSGDLLRGYIYATENY